MTVRGYHVQFLPRLGSFWVGIHYSFRNRSVCMALVPGLVIRVGKTAYQKDPDIFCKRRRIPDDQVNF